jgi:hypothetical protein
MQDSEGNNFGQEATERGMGFAPMLPHSPVDQPDDAPIESSQDNLHGLANEIAGRRSQEQQIREGRAVDVERKYYQQSGPKVGEHMPENQTVSPEQAAHDLALARKGEALTEQQELDRLLAQAIDEVRGEQPP